MKYLCLEISQIIYEIFHENETNFLFVVDIFDGKVVENVASSAS